MIVERYRVEKTTDNSPTIHDATFNETFHSVFGARTESLHVFINHGLKHFSDKSVLNILEMGFGTGLNALLTLLHKNEKQLIYYESVEKFPLPDEITNTYTSQMESGEQKIYKSITQASWNKEIQINPQFILHKRNEDISEAKFNKEFNLIYFDAFSPKTQPELWTVELFISLYNCLLSGGILVTYASSGVVKNNLRQAGFKVERLPGPPHKHHMVRAWKVKYYVV